MMWLSPTDEQVVGLVAEQLLRWPSKHYLLGDAVNFCAGGCVAKSR